jgi:hypothetical protein
MKSDAILNKICNAILWGTILLVLLAACLLLLALPVLLAVKVAWQWILLYLLEAAVLVIVASLMKVGGRG